MLDLGGLGLNTNLCGNAHLPISCMVQTFARRLNSQERFIKCNNSFGVICCVSRLIRHKNQEKFYTVSFQINFLPEVHFMTLYMTQLQVMSLSCESYMTSHNKQIWRPAERKLSAIYIPFIAFVRLLSKLISNHWWQYSSLVGNLNEMQEKTYLKVVLLGKVNSGKTCLVTRYITRSFSEETPSVSKIFFSQQF